MGIEELFKNYKFGILVEKLMVEKKISHVKFFDELYKIDENIDGKTKEIIVQALKESGISIIDDYEEKNDYEFYQSEKTTKNFLENNVIKENSTDTKVMLCEECNETLIKGAKFCHNCGEKVVIKIICIECGTLKQDNWKFCIECGTKYGVEGSKEIKKVEELKVMELTSKISKPERSLL